ncbi:MAG: hypothetical protein L0Y70_11400 [Gemmataceae bacterium]|nr:hypothetical protein [Gemmataceae bacterium]
MSPRIRLVFLGEIYHQGSGERLDQTLAPEWLPLPFETEALGRMLEGTVI